VTLESNEYTLTMARVYAGQGHWEKAVEIYRYLAAAQPDREDLQDALHDAQKRLEEQGAKRLEDLSPLLKTWLTLQTRVHQLRKLSKIKG
jgi:hypothetical protein